MTLPHLYKYLDIRGAKLTLENGMFKHSKPSDFNDTEDLTVDSVFPEELATAYRKVGSTLPEVIHSHVNNEPMCSSPMREQIMQMQQVFRRNPEAVVKIQEDLENTNMPDAEVHVVQSVANTLITDINLFLQDYRVFCVSSENASEHMWEEYAEDHKGIALRIQPNLAKDSKFRLFRPVNYREKRPPLYEDAGEFLAGALFGNQEEISREICNRIIYTKTLDWQKEAEYRLAIPLAPDEEPWELLPFHPEEITELYLGLNMDAADREEIVKLALSLNPKIAIYRAYRDFNGKIVFDGAPSSSL